MIQNVVFQRLIFRQIIAYKNLIEALEHISIAMALALGFFTSGTLNPVDYREFIRFNSLSKEHLESAKHFLQLESIFDFETDVRLTKWYQHLTYHTIISIYQENRFENRHKLIFDPPDNESHHVLYFHFMNTDVLPRIRKFQNSIRSDMRFDNFE